MTNPRDNLEKILSSQDFCETDDPLFWHGRVFANSNHDLNPPQITWESPDKPRDDHTDHTNLDWLTASEYLDVSHVMEQKIDQLAHLLQLSKRTVVYSGAGISVAAGIGQASRGSKRRGHPHFQIHSTTAMPTTTHYALCGLANHGLIHGWVQQNHDGLPQKAGFAQELINEIHGSWYDPSNPVVLYSGSLRDAEYNNMLKDAENADLVLVLGTSLSGLNADQVALNAATRSLNKEALGMVIINLQQTPHDGKASLRIFGSSDDVFQTLFSKMSNLTLPSKPKVFSSSPHERIFVVPYNAQGQLTKTKTMHLNLEIGAAVEIVNHNIEGAGQPSHQSMVRNESIPRGKISDWNDSTMAIEISMEPGNKKMLLGYWWIETAIRGKTPTIPIVNILPRVFNNE